MYLIGDIGNTEIKIFLFNRNFIKKKKNYFYDKIYIKKLFK